ncbi:hypothetical protein HDV01_004398 [Terramyces sp. JEL0728]|nr:hypothetical protein HDV01_004398 [Terramyces sp. JEL0728]
MKIRFPKQIVKRLIQTDTEAFSSGIPTRANPLKTVKLESQQDTIKTKNLVKLINHYNTLVEIKRPSLSLYKQILDACIERQDVNTATLLYSKLLLINHKPDDDIHAKMVRIFASVSDLESVLNYLQKIETKSTVLYNSIIRAFLKLNDLGKAEYIYSLVKERNLETEALYLEARAANMEETEMIPFILQESQKLRLSYTGDVSELNILDETVMQKLSKINYKEAIEYLKLNPSTRMYNILLAKTKPEDIPNLFSEMKPNTETFEIVLGKYLSVYQQLKNDKFQYYLDKMKRCNIEPNSKIYSMIVQYLIMNEMDYLTLAEYLLQNEYEIEANVINMIMMGINKQVFHIVAESRQASPTAEIPKLLETHDELKRLDTIFQKLFAIHSNQHPSSYIYNEMFKNNCFLHRDVDPLITRMIQMNIQFRFNNLYQYCLTQKWSSKLLPWIKNWNHFQIIKQTAKYQMENVPKPLYYIPKHVELQTVLAMISSYCQKNKRAVKVQNIYGNPSIRDKHLYHVWKCFGWRADVLDNGNYGGFTNLVLRYCDLNHYFAIKEKILAEIVNK